MAVNIQVDEPDIEIAVTAYDGYVEVTGIAAPLAVGDAQVVKGNIVDAGPATTGLVVGDAETTKGNTVEGGASTSLVTGDGQTDKGSAVAADGTGVQVDVGGVETSEGEATQAGGASAPLAVGNARTEHLKPTHRWQMPQPRNLLDDPESFDPASTMWNTLDNTTYSTVDNIGPNGETAAHFDRSGEGSDGYMFNTKDIPNLSGFFSQGLYVRSVSGSGELKLEHQGGNNKFVTFTVNTKWQWLKINFEQSRSNNETLTEFRVLDLGVRGIYVLRAGLNRGSSLEYSTRSQVAQEIPDVIGGADLSNGSTESADTNDLSFGVDGSGVPYAVSDGDDKVGEIDFEPGTYVWRVYVSGGATIFNEGSIRLSTNISRGGWALNWRDKEGNKTINAYSGIGDIYNNAWNTVAITIGENYDYIRFNGNGNVTSRDVSDEDMRTDFLFSLFDSESGNRLSHVEQHPVLSEAEAEAVRQRLATNPPDPVPVTEAWDLTAESNPHNLVTHSEDFSQWSGSATVTTDTDTAPDGSTTADTVEDTSSSNFDRVRENKTISFLAGERYTALINVKKGSSAICTLQNKVVNQDAAAVDLDPSSGDIATNTFGSDEFVRAGVIDRGDYYLLYVVSEIKADGIAGFRMTFFPAIGSSLGSTDSSETGSQVVWGAQLVRGDIARPTYIQTGSSIAFPQTVPALRDSSNDLTLGSTSGADTSDPSWVAPIGLVGDGNDDQLNFPVFRNGNNVQVTWIVRTQTQRIPSNLSTAGWVVNFVASSVTIYAKDKDGNIINQDFSVSVNPNLDHVHAIVVDEENNKITYYINNNKNPVGTLDISGIGDLIKPQSQDIFTLGRYSPSTGKAAHVYTRALSDEEALYARQRILDNPEDPYPNYTTP